jgi:hypothetical protein
MNNSYSDIDVTLRFKEKNLSIQISINSDETLSTLKLKCLKILSLNGDLYDLYICGIHLGEFFNFLSLYSLLKIFSTRDIEIRLNFLKINSDKSESSETITKNIILLESTSVSLKNLEKNINDLEHTFSELCELQRNILTINKDLDFENPTNYITFRKNDVFFFDNYEDSKF